MKKAIQKVVLSARRSGNKPVDPVLPDPPLTVADVPTIPTATIRNREVTAMLEALLVFNIAKADFEKKRGNVLLKVIQLAKLEDDRFYDIYLNRHGGLAVTDHGSSPSQRYIIGEGDASRELLR